MLTTLQRFSGFVAAALGALTATSQVQAEPLYYGGVLFKENCAVCHGETGAGDGLVAELFRQRPKDLRGLAKENGGVFPFDEVYAAIDGRTPIAGHGESQMPVWGNVLLAEALPKTVHPGIEAEEIVEGRILMLVYHIQGLQEP